MEEGLHYEEFCGSIYLRKGNSKDILRMVDGTDEIALAFDREGFGLIRQGSPASVSEYMMKFEASFPGFLASITLPKGFPLVELNEALRTQNVRALITTLPRGSGFYHPAKGPGERPMTGCDKCYHTGAIDAGFNDVGIPITRPCACQIARDIVRNVNRAWPNLSSAPKIESSPLSELTGDDVYITASDASLRAHLRHVGLRMGAKWGFKVHTDADLMTAWLAPIAIAGKEILDPEATAVSTERATLVDLTEPPELLILRLGVKSARNSAMGEVLLEALYHRAHIGKPVWVVDQPGRLFNPAHIAFSEDALHHISQWERVVLDEVGPGLSIEMVSHGEQGHAAEPTHTRVNALTLSAGYSTPNAAASATTRIERPVAEPKKKKFKRTEE